ncbi:MAG: hypothetical protein ACI9MR_001497 [Myxococcota bacterium]|jgi:hypothetical protein
MSLTIIIACFVAVSGCKPAEEPARHPGVKKTSNHRIRGISDPGLDGASRPSGTVLVGQDDPVTGADPREGIAPIPPIVGAFTGDATIGDPDSADTTSTTGRDDASTRASDTVDGTDTLAADTVLTQDTVTGGVAAVSLPEALVERVRATPSAYQEKRARDLNRAGLRKHRRFDLDAAIQNYVAALDAWPGHPFSNYNLACAYALTERPNDALRHLAIVSVIGGEDSRERMRKARMDQDFDSLHDDIRFREITGFVPVRVSWSPSRDEGAQAARLAAALVAQKVPAKTKGPWRNDAAKNSLLVRSGDRLAASMAAEVLRGIALDELVVVERDDLTDAAPVVLVLAGRPRAPLTPTPAAPALPDADDPRALAGGEPKGTLPVPSGSPAPPPAEAEALSPGVFEGFVGRQLTARDGDSVQRLRLKTSGFFRWEHSSASGTRTVKTGRYQLREGRLALTFKKVSEDPTKDPTAPTIRTDEGQRSEHALGQRDGALVLDGTAFSVR